MRVPNKIFYSFLLKIKSLLCLPIVILIIFACSKNNNSTFQHPRTWAEISESGKLRILTTLSNAEKVSTNISNKEIEHTLLKSFADEKQLKPEYVFVDAFNELFDALNDGKGDLIASNISITEEREKIYDFTKPVFSTQDVIVASVSSPASNLNDMKAGKLYIEPGTSYFDIVEDLNIKIPALRIVSAPYFESTGEILEKTATGQYDFSITDLKHLSGRSNLKIIYKFPYKDNIAWALPKNSQLTPVLNSFIEQKLKFIKKSYFTGDLAQIKKRGFIRVLTRNNPVCYFIHRGTPMGFEYQLISLFAEKHNLKVVAIVPPEWNDLFEWLKEGKGDVIAAGMSLTGKRKAYSYISFSEPYKQIRQYIVCRKNEESKFKNLKDLRNHTIAVRKNSSYREQLEKLQEKGIEFKIKILPENMETYEIIKKVSEGVYELTVADDVFVKTSTVYDKISAPFPISEPESYVWGVRRENNELLQGINIFIKETYKSKDYNILANRYFCSHSTRNKFERAVIDKNNSRISPYDGIIRKYASKYDLPWCLIASQMYQESRFNPNAKSWSGANGLLQLMKKTAEEMECSNPHNPIENIKAGVKYLKYLYNRLPSGINDKNKICFALAAYNGGYGHVQDARKLAARLNYNQNKWFGHVENAMRLLSEKKYYSKAKYGYCRADEVVSYVRNILIRYVEYSQNFEN